MSGFGLLDYLANLSAKYDTACYLMLDWSGKWSQTSFRFVSGYMYTVYGCYLELRLGYFPNASDKCRADHGAFGTSAREDDKY